MKRIILIIACMSMALSTYAKVPVIGISTSHSTRGSSSSAGDSYVQSVIMAGGVPVLLPENLNEEVAKRMVRSIDGLVMVGGEDFNPSYFGEKVYNATVSINHDRDTSDLLILKYALKRNIPILGICRGCQALNVAMGGSLYQDLPAQKPSDIRHKQKEDGSVTTHAVVLDRNSYFYKLVGTDTVMVNTFHHQAVKSVGDGLNVVGTATDGVCEIIEGRKGRIIGVQFHPEKLVYSGDLFFLPLFVNLVEKSK